MSVPTLMTVAVAKNSSNDRHTCEDGRGRRQKRKSVVNVQKRTRNECVSFHNIVCLTKFVGNKLCCYPPISNFCWKQNPNRQHVGNRKRRVDATKCRAIIPMLYVHASDFNCCGREI